MSAPSTPLEWAHWAVGRGWFVFPADHPELPECVNFHGGNAASCAERGKHPEGKWKSSATQSSKALAHRFKQPRNVGIHCGDSGLLVLDEDCAGGLVGLADALGVDLPETFTVWTREGRRHLYFLAPDGLSLGNRPGIFKDHGIDVRGDGGYVIGPGSKHESGAIYTPVDLEAEVVPTPAWVVDLLRVEDGPERPSRKAERSAHQPTATTPPAVVTERARAWAESALEYELENVRSQRVGDRNTTLNNAALKLFKKVAGGLLDEEQVREELLAVAMEAGLSRTNAEDTIASGRAKGLTQPEFGPPDDPESEGPNVFDREVEREVRRMSVRDEARRQYLGSERPSIPPFLTYTELLAQPLPPVKYRIEGLWPVNSNVILAAQYKAGKTTLRDNITRSLVDGAPLFGQFGVHPIERRVVVLDFELSPAMAQQWIRDQGYADTDRLTFVGMRGSAASFDVTHRPTMLAWAERIRQADCGVLVVDCLGPIMHALGLDENSEYGRLLTALDQLAAEANVEELFLVHHMGHQGERSKGDARLRGWPDVEWHLLRENEDDPASPRFFRAYGRDVNFAENEIVYDLETRHMSLSEDGRTRKKGRGRAGQPARSVYDRDREVVVKVLSESLLPMTIQQVLEAVKKIPGTGSFDRTKVSRLLNQLATDERAEATSESVKGAKSWRAI